ncbi:MAG TPA: NAD+ synthase [Solirubrobacterales bacterium]|nr:NAD+ synthase [Solirubrobacterales bacterium]
MRVALVQIDPTVGDVDGNATKITAWIGRAREAGAELAIFPELCIPGYPAEDLYLKPHFLAANVRAVERLAAALEPGITVMVGFAEPVAGGGDHRHAHNSLAVLADGAVQAVYRKNRLPNYAVFDEQRYFIPGAAGDTVAVGDTEIGLTICEDTWTPGPPGQAEADAGAALIANPSGSPYHRGKGHEREEMFGERAREYGAYLAFVNLVGGQDELVFDGQSLLFGPDGAVLARAAQFEEELLIAEVPAAAGAPAPLAEPLSDLDEVYGALVLGLRDYVEKNGFGHVGLGISGGIDSALVAMLAVDALGPDRVTLVVMPSPHSSDETQADARQIAHNLGTELIEIGIGPMMEGYREALDRHLRPAGEDADASPTDPTRPSEPDLAAENIQARIRGNLMMALSNRHGWLVLTTGNKSEMSVGYATLYGDMAGGFAVIKDVPKTLVYRLVERRNERAGRELVPAAVIERPPSAELRPDQLDSDSLPDYDLLDRILEAYVERDGGRDEMIAAGLPGDVVDEVIRLVDRAEYKRRQAAPGIRITPRAFGRDRRLPITNRFGG